MLKFLGIIGMAAILAACSTSGPTINPTQMMVHRPPNTLFNCPQVNSFPIGPTVKNRDIANTIEKLYSANRICGANMNAIKNNLDDAEKIYTGQ